MFAQALAQRLSRASAHYGCPIVAIVSLIERLAEART